MFIISQEALTRDPFPVLPDPCPVLVVGPLLRLLDWWWQPIRVYCLVYVNVHYHSDGTMLLFVYTYTI